MKTKSFRPLLCLIVLALSAGPALAETRMEKTLKLEPGGEFRLETDIGRVTVTGTSSPGVRLIVTSRRDDINDLLSFRYEEGVRSASVIARKRHHLDFLFGSWSSSVRFEVEVPSETAVTVHTSGGGISLAALRSPAKIETSGGGIEVSIDPAVGLRIDASGNSVKADIPITVQGSISRGKLQGNMGGGGELLRLRTSGGGVRIQGL
jgi:hypothetical protein